MRMPQHKSDIEAVELLQRLSSHDLVPVIPELLEWMQDMNWPVARPVATLLSTMGMELVEPIREILRSDDDVWKTWVLSDLLCDVAPLVRLALADDVLRIINSPTRGEELEGAVEAARDVYILITYNDCTGDGP